MNELPHILVCPVDDRVEHRLVRSVAHLHDTPGGRVVVVHNDAAGAVVVVPRPLLFGHLCCLAVEDRHRPLIAFSTRALIPANAGHHHAALSMGFFQRLTTIPRQTGRRELLVDDQPSHGQLRNGEMDAPLPGDTLGCHRREQPTATVDGKVFERPVGQVVDHRLELADHEAYQLRRVNGGHVVMDIIAHPGHAEDGFHHDGILAAAVGQVVFVGWFKAAHQVNGALYLVPFFTKQVINNQAQFIVSLP